MEAELKIEMKSFVVDVVVMEVVMDAVDTVEISTATTLESEGILFVSAGRLVEVLMDSRIGGGARKNNFPG